MNNEIWKSIPNYENYYVSNLGNIKRNNKLLKQWNLTKKLYKNYSYKCVSLSKNGIVKKFLVHRLVASSFVNNPLLKSFVNHINCNSIDNRAENLEWVTNKENLIHASKNGLMERGSKRHNAKLKEEDILKIRSLSGIKSHIEISKMFNISQPIVTRIINKKVWKHVE